MNQAEWYVINAVLVCHLWKALYDLKHASSVWYALISEFLQELEFTKTNADHSVFVFHDKSTFISVYVDNLIIISEDLNIINSIKNKLCKYFWMTDFRLVS